MISLQRFRKFLLTVGLAALLATATAFCFGSTESWAATPIVDVISQSQPQLLAMNQVEKVTKNLESKAQEALGRGTDKPKAQTSEQVDQFKSKTLEGIDHSIGDSSKQSTGKTKQAGKEARESTEQMETEARDAFK